MIQVTVAFDVDDDWTFATEVPCIQFRSFIGMKSALERVADACEASLMVRSGAGDHARVGRFVRITGKLPLDAAVPIYTGVILSVDVASIPAVTTIECRGRWHNADGVITFPIMEDVSADEVIEQALELAGLPRRLARDGTPDRDLWILGKGLLGKSTVLGGRIEDVDLETGIGTFAYVGDQYSAVSPRRVVTDATLADWGWFFEDKDGTFRFVDRLSPLLPGVAHEIAGVSDYNRLRGDVVNEVVIGLEPVYVQEDVTLWSSNAAMRFRPGITERSISFRDGEGRRVGLHGLPVFDWTFYTAGTGGSVVSGESYQLRVDADGAGAVIHMDNVSADPIFLQAGATIEGDGLYHDPRVEFVSRDLFSQNIYGTARLPVELPSFADPGFADDLADAIVNVYSGSTARLTYFELRGWSEETREQQIGIELLDLVRVHTGAAAHVVQVVGIEQFYAGGVLRSVFWCGPVHQSGYWILGRSLLGVGTVLAL